MADVLKDWLTERLKRPINWKPQEFGDLMKNGHIIAAVLHSYRVIHEEKLLLIRPSNLPADIKMNWNYLKEWLKDVDIFLNDQDLNNYKKGKGSALLRLFYQLFLYLDKKDRTNFLKHERKLVSNLVEKMENRFTAESISEEQESDTDYLSKPLLNEMNYMEWQKQKEKEIKDAHDFLRHRFKSILDSKQGDSKIPCHKEETPPKNEKLTLKDQLDIANFLMKNPCTFKNYTYEELLEMEKQWVEHEKNILDTDWAKAYMDDLHNRIPNESDSEQFQKQLCKSLSTSLWEMQVGEEGAKVDKDLSKTVMKLSQFEKQKCTQTMEAKLQARNMTKNRIEADRAFADQRELQLNQYFDYLKEQIHLDGVEIDLEKQRQENLHKILYAEKMKRKRQHWYEICYETMLSLVDYATKYAYWKMLLENDIPDHYIHEWKNLFFKMQPIFELLTPMEELLKQHDQQEEVEPEEEETIGLELGRQEALNECEFLEYHNYVNPWDPELLIPNYDFDSQDAKYEYLGSRILGHVVYRLLEIKYPYPPSRPPADLPPFSSKALLCGLPDKYITIPMQILLNKRFIRVVRLESAINFCLLKYKEEMIGCIDIDLSYDKFVTNQPEEEAKDLIRSIKKEEETNSKTSEATSSAVLEPLPSNCKITQTPKSLPEENMTLSSAAELGKYAYEALSFGDTLTDYLLAAMLVEYIKDIKCIDGFVIVNYPNNYRQAHILEETFSGREPPDEAELLEESDAIYLEETIAKHRKKEYDPYKDIRVSKLVLKPQKRQSELPFESYFTCYIKMKETEDILQENVIWDLTEANSELIDIFYAALGINYSVYYEVIEKDLLALLCKYIIGDLSMPLKSYSSLFGENVLSELVFPASDDKRTKHNVIKPVVSSTNQRSKTLIKRVKSKTRKVKNSSVEILKHADSSLEIADNSISPVDEAVEEEQNEISIQSVKVLPGEDEWEYTELPIPKGLGIALASFWEEIERSYIHDLQQLLFSKRLQMNCLVPYCRFIKDKMEQIVKMPSFKQDLVSQFQKEYNEFEDDWRDAIVSKNEWHCRIEELKHKLYRICDDRKIFAEQQRRKLITDNWITEELTALANTYISCMQTEMNRSFMTYQVLHDFYMAALKKLSLTERVGFSPKDLIKISKFADDTSGSHSTAGPGAGSSSSARKSVEDKVFKQLKNALLDMQMKNIALDYGNNPINMILENDAKFAQRTVKELSDSQRAKVSKEQATFAPKPCPPPAKNIKKDEIYPPASQESADAEIFQKNAMKACDEWMMAIVGEMYRLNKRINVLHQKCLADMILINNCVYRAFSEIQNSIDEYYMNEIKSVDRLCKYLQMAVEHGKRIPETLILEHDTFIIDYNLLQFEPTLPKEDLDSQEEIVDSMIQFKVSQLLRLRSQFKIFAPTGIALQRGFVFMLQDFLFFGKESCEGPVFPELFKRIDPERVNKLTNLLFGDTAYVDWRDFLIYCLQLRFPTMKELLHIRRQFRCNDCNNTELLDKEDFMSEELWFEQEFDPDDGHAKLRLNLVKHFLFELFEMKPDKINYSALLLALCKSHDPREGFAMALAMACGKDVCYKWEECGEVVTQFINLKKYRDECAKRCAAEILDEAIDKVISSCVGTTIEDLGNVELDNDVKKDKKGAKKKGQSPVKPVASAVVKEKPDSDVTQTFICPPCDEPAVPEEHKRGEEVLPEAESASEVSEDTDLIYAVPQSVIWKVLKICLPWHFALIPDRKSTPYEQRVQEVLKNLEDNHDAGDIYVSQFLMEPEIRKILCKVHKFTALDLIEEVRKVCYDQPVDKERIMGAGDYAL